MRALVPWLAVILVSVVVHAVAAASGWSDLATYVALLAVGLPVTVVAVVWVDGTASWRRHGDPRGSNLG
jgi:hypothetical protein